MSPFGSDDFAYPVGQSSERCCHRTMMGASALATTHWLLPSLPIFVPATVAHWST